MRKISHSSVMHSSRLWFLLRIILICAALIILFFSGIAPLEEYLAVAPQVQSLPASVVAADVAALTNQNREQYGLSDLSVNPLLTQAAQLKAEDMASNSYYAHVSPDGKSPLYWFQLVGYRYLNAGENLVIDRDTSQQAVDAWMNSQAHRENILRPQFTEIGVGVAKGQYKGEDTIYVVQEFGTPYPLATPRVAAKPKPPSNAQLATAASTGEQREAPVKLPSTSIIAEVAHAAAPFVRALEPSFKKAVAPVQLPAFEATTTTANAAATSTTGSTTVITSSFAYTLPPEFFAPVSYAPLPSSTIQHAGREESLQGSHIASTGPALPALQVARPQFLADFMPTLKAGVGYIATSFYILLR